MKVLEHEILKTLYNQAGFTLASVGSDAKGHLPIYRRTYEMSMLHFGTLVDVINNPDKYTLDKRPIDQVDYIQNLSLTKEEISFNKNDYRFNEIADALEILLLNEHIKDESQGNFLDYSDRVIILTLKGAIDYRSGFYLKESRNEKLKDLEFNHKKYYFLYDISKMFMSAIMGGAIAWLIKPQLAPLTPRTQSEQIRNIPNRGSSLDTSKQHNK